MQVILRNYNKNPSVFINVKLNTFITEVANQLFEVSQELWALRNGPNADQLTEDRVYKLRGNPERMSNDLRKFWFLSYKAQLQLTTLLLSIEQLLYNEFNPNLLQTRKDEKINPQAKLTV